MSSARAFLRKCSTVIVAASIALWLALNLPLHSPAQLQAAGVDTGDSVAVSAYTVDHSYAADLGRLVSPVFDPLASTGASTSASCRHSRPARPSSPPSGRSPPPRAPTIRRTPCGP